MFESFTEEFVDVGAARLFVRQGGSGEPIVLLHGHPRTSATWHRVAPLLMDAGYAVVCPDLRGYGRSSGPDPTSDHAAHSKAAMAADIAALMQEFGHSRFHVVGHDRGSYVAFSLARHHPRRVRRLVLLECIPIVEHLERISAEFATAWWHWFFFAQPEKPERAINADPEAWYRVDPERMGRENFAEWQRAVHDPAVIRAMLEDYRAGLGVDRADEEAARRSRGHLAQLGRRRTRSRDRQRTPHRRRRAAGAGGRDHRLSRKRRRGRTVMVRPRRALPEETT